MATGIPATTFTETVPASEQAVGYRYKVEAAYAGNVGESAQSNGLCVGTSKPACSYNLDDVSGFDAFSVVDANSDGKTWIWYKLGPGTKAEYNNSYSSNIGKDDWLISPGIELEAGKMYEVAFDVASQNVLYLETFEVKAGTAATAEGMTLDIVAPTEVRTDESTGRQTLKNFFVAPSTGIYYIGLHAMTPGKTYDAWVHSFSIGTGVSGDAPGAVTGLSVTSDPDAGVKAEIAFNAPTLTISGAALSAISKIELARDGEVIKTFENPAPGAALTYTDESATEAEHTYTLTPYNATGAGRPETRTIFVGDNRPYAPYSCSFDDMKSIIPFTIINGDGDSYKWSSYSNAVRVQANTTSGSNDYLILPAVWLKAGYRYTFSADIRSNSDWDTDPFEFVFGTEPTAAGMNQVLLEEANTQGYDYHNYQANVDISESGLYYFGIRYKGSDYYSYLYADNVAVSEGMLVGAPAKIEDFAATPDFGGELKTVITFTAPDKDLLGNPMAVDLQKVVLTRDGEELHVFQFPQKGSAISYTDETPTRGYHTYAVTPYGSVADETTETTVYVGTNVPTAPTAPTIAEEGTGTVTLTWAAPETDVDGNEINQALVSYVIYRASIFGDEPEIIARNVNGTTYTYKAVEEGGEQEFLYYYIYAMTAGGMSEKCATTEVIPVGNAYTMPFRESFPEGTINHAFCSERIGDYPGDWIAYSDRSMANLEPQDGDNGVMGFYAPYGSGVSRLYTGKIDLTGASAPVFSLWYYARQECTCTVSIEIREAGAIDWTLMSEAVAAADFNGWAKLSANLAGYIGKTVQIAIRANADQHNYVMFDNFRLENQYEKNLAALSITVPSEMSANESSEITVKLENEGTANVAPGSYSVDLYRNGAKVQTVAGPGMTVDAITTVTFTETPTVTFDSELTYYATVVLEGDGNVANNTTGEATSLLRLPIFPVITDLTATTDQSVNTLTWSEPVISVTPAQPVTETFESYPSFAKADLGEWLLYDGDKEPFGGFSGISMPGINGPLSWFVMDAAWENMPADPDGVLTGHSGSKYMASGVTYGSTMLSDDWLISPRISVASGEVKFFAKSLDAQFLESMEVMSSSTDRAIGSFTRVESINNIPSVWTEYAVQLPAGSRFFALRGVSRDKFMLFVDDVTYTPMTSDSEPLQIAGYKVYRDGSCITPAPVEETTFADNTAEPQKEVRYVVTAVYDQGESAASNEAVITTSGIGDVVTGAITVEVVGRNIIVTGADGLNVSLVSADGRVLASVTGAPRTILPAPAGVVIVRAGSLTTKVAVK